MCEALANGRPVIASRISGLIGTLGHDYPGYFEPLDTQALAAQLSRVESDSAFYEELRERCAAASQLLLPERERAAWQELLAEFT